MFQVYERFSVDSFGDLKCTGLVLIAAATDPFELVFFSEPSFTDHLGEPAFDIVVVRLIFKLK
jgi:hypothetical protein